MFLTDSTCPYGAGVEFEFIIENGQVQSFTFNGGTYYGGNPVPDQAEHKKSDPAVKAAMAGAKPIRINQLAGAVPQSYSAEFALTFSQGPKTLTVGRFHQKGKQVYLLVNRLQKDISVEVKGQKSVQMLDPSTGKIKKVSLPATLPIKAVRALMLIP
ncbi:hypothetical protein BSZ32_06375 [Rubritalea profundi]|uniref:Uncharacterized protein n=2 Tax=Rubritalea profundi TaxID=1658618 RepID=A0A2S7U1V8_9BACT|nr:hypothetical protein BSZ32_06375 [Rubritalea profundi]